LTLLMLGTKIKQKTKTTAEFLSVNK
jgi:hypothetical protein